jgi:two-component system phosphate regulon sensor histidine kinase PhoR
MKRKIFHHMVMLMLLIFVLSITVSMHEFYRHDSQVRMEALQTEAAMLAALAGEKDEELLQEYSEQIGRDVAWIGDGGEILFVSRDLSRKTVNEIQSQPEVQEAKKTGRGSSTQHLRNAFEQMFTYALRLDDGSILYISSVENTVFFFVIPLFWWILILALLGVVLSFGLSERITRTVTKPLHEARLEDLEVQNVCEELRPLASRMLDQNRQMQRQLQKQYSTLKRGYEKQDRMRRDFTANVSHELKTPLTSISGYAEIIRNGIVKEEDISRFAGKIYDETQRLIVLVGDILKLSQLEDGHQVRVDRVSIDLFATCERTIAALQVAANERRANYRRNCLQPM